MGRRIPQIPDNRRPGCDAIFDSSYLEDIAAELKARGLTRIVIVYSKTLAAQTDVIKNLEHKLGHLIVGRKAGVGAHSPYKDVIEIAHLLSECDADVLLSIGSGSYTDACKVARLLHATLPRGFTADDVENLIDPETGRSGETAIKKPTKVKFICVPTSLSAGEWNWSGSSTNAAGKKQHFGLEDGGAPELVLMDPEVASTAPQQLWLASGLRAIDHCVESLCNHAIDEHPDAIEWAESSLALLVKGLTEYKQGRDKGQSDELIEGISLCQQGSRSSLLPFAVHRIPMGASHAIGHQVGSVAGVMHGVTSAILLPKVLRYTKDNNPEAQSKVLKIINETMRWHEQEAADAVARFIKTIRLPNSLSCVGVTDDEQISRMIESSLTDTWGGQKRQLEREDIAQILNAAR